MHTQALVAHGDIKPENLVISKEFRMLMIDLGHSDRVLALARHSTGTHGYRPVEVGTGAEYSLA